MTNSFSSRSQLRGSRRGRKILVAAGGLAGALGCHQPFGVNGLIALPHDGGPFGVADACCAHLDDSGAPDGMIFGIPVMTTDGGVGDATEADAGAADAAATDGQVFGILDGGH
jgi:hypothetical protein